MCSIDVSRVPDWKLLIVNLNLLAPGVEKGTPARMDSTLTGGEVGAYVG